MTGRIVKYLEPVSFEKFTPAVARTAKPKNPTPAKSRLAKPDEDDDEVTTRKVDTMTNEIDRGPFYKMLDRLALARQSQTGESYAAAFTKVYEDPKNAAIRDGAKYDDLAKSMDSIYGTSKSLIPIAKAAPPDPSQDYVSPGPANDKLNELVMTRMKSDPKLSYQQAFTHEYLLPANRSLKDRVDSEGILRAQAREPAPPFPAYARS
jgi:hypothetical protein